MAKEPKPPARKLYLALPLTNLLFKLSHTPKKAITHLKIDTKQPSSPLHFKASFQANSRQQSYLLRPQSLDFQLRIPPPSFLNEALLSSHVSLQERPQKESDPKRTFKKPQKKVKKHTQQTERKRPALYSDQGPLSKLTLRLNFPKFYWIESRLALSQKNKEIALKAKQDSLSVDLVMRKRKGRGEGECRAKYEGKLTKQVKLTAKCGVEVTNHLETRFKKCGVSLEYNSTN